MSSPRQDPRRAMVALGLCMVLGLGAGVAVTVGAEPEASAAAVAGVVEDNLGVEAGDAIRDAYEAARSGDRMTPPAPVFPLDAGAAVEAEGAPERDAASAGKSAPPAPVAEPEQTPEPGSGLLGTDVTVKPELSGKLVVASGSHAAPAEGKVWRVQVAVEKGLPVDPEVFAEAVLTTLNDPRGWNGADGSTFARTDSDRYDVRVVLASPGTTDRLCLPLDTIGELSCGIKETAVLNFKRWATGSGAWKDVRNYRHYLVNHEVGHVIGYHHDLCRGKGEHATVMVQQTRTTSGCIPEPWPAPDAG
ncbi:DUF3152 domain-containing protein [Promicromonospora sp. NPDC060204]|uniref:DUF3152 domain-containing protein n=1 Tax=Promicromonospora sp. NPDC060204 TaxID=3347071 RepID=UPI00364D9BFA